MMATRHRPSVSGCQSRYVEAQPHSAVSHTSWTGFPVEPHLPVWTWAGHLITGIIKAPVSWVAASTMPCIHLSITQVLWLLPNEVYSQGVGKYFYWRSFNLSEKFYLRVVGTDIRRRIAPTYWVLTLWDALFCFHFKNHPNTPILQMRKLNPREVKEYIAGTQFSSGFCGMILKGHAKEFGRATPYRDSLSLFIALLRTWRVFPLETRTIKKPFIGITGHL